MPRRPPFAPELLRRRLDPDLPGVEARLAAYRREAFARHIHETWSVGLVLSGATRVGLTGRTALLWAGRLACLAPGEAHACNPVPGTRLAYVMFHLEPALVARIAGREAPERFAATLPEDARLARPVAALFRAMGRPGSRLEKEALLARALRPLLPAAGPDRQADHGTRDRDAARTVTSARDYLRAHFRDNVSLATLAGLCGQSPTRLLRRFTRLTGLPPHSYQNHLRVEAAKTLLAKGLAAATVALDVGFADQSHLIRTFTPLVGATPGQYQRAVRDD